MTKAEIVQAVQGLGLKRGSFIVFGSCPLAMVGIREAKDIDLLVTPAVLEELQQAGWHQIHKGPGDEPYVSGVFEAHDNWNFSDYQPPLEDLLSRAMVVDGVDFASLEDVRKWKATSNLPKHDADIKLIDEYLQRR